MRETGARRRWWLSYPLFGLALLAFLSTTGGAGLFYCFAAK